MQTTQMASNFWIILPGIAGVFFGIGLAIYGISTWFLKEKKASNRVDDFVTSEIRLTEDSGQNRIIAREVKGSLFQRTIVLWVNNILGYLGRFTPVKMALELEHKLIMAGKQGSITAGRFYALRFLLLTGGIIIALFINRDFNNLNFSMVIFGLIIIFGGYFLPGFWLNKEIKTRQDEIQRALPDALDMLSVCASAGLGFDQSLQKISQYWDTELGDEFKIVTQEMEMGLPRAMALKNLSNRAEVDDLTRFVAILIQAEKIGMSYASVLQSQAGQLRILRQLRAREIANTLPGKMIIPLAIFIFPAMMAVILGPSIPLFLEMF